MFSVIKTVMDISEDILCGLCLDKMIDKNINEVTQDIIAEVLAVVLPSLVLSNRNQQVVCSSCSAKLYAAFLFKEVCLKTEARIFPYISSAEKLPLDLKTIYLNEKDDRELQQEVCRICVDLIYDEVLYLENLNQEMISKYIPEVNLNISNNPVICQKCFNTLDTHCNFLMMCLNTQEKLKKTLSKGVSESNCIVKYEEIDIAKVEEIEQTSEICVEWAEKEKCVIDDENSKCDILNSDQPPNLLVNTNVFNCEQLENKQHSTSDDNESSFEFSEIQMFEDNYSTYETNLKQNPKKHKVTHKNISKGKIYRCSDCDYKTKQKYNLQIHQLGLRQLNEAQTFKCNNCSYETKHKNCLKNHGLIHKNALQLEMYKCDFCSYETKTKSNFRNHSLVHKDPSEVQMHKCKECDFQTKRKRSLKVHQLRRHRQMDEIQTFKCNDCSYETKSEYNLTKHCLIHKGPSEVQMYKCNECGFQTKSKTSLKIHQVKHRELYEVQTFKRNGSFETKRKHDHFLIHKDPSEVNACDFQIKYKTCLKTDQLKHRQLSEMQTFKCNDCSYETKLKSRLKTHLVRFHKNPLQLQSANVIGSIHMKLKLQGISQAAV